MTFYTNLSATFHSEMCCWLLICFVYYVTFTVQNVWLLSEWKLLDRWWTPFLAITAVWTEEQEETWYLLHTCSMQDLFCTHHRSLSRNLLLSNLPTFVYCLLVCWSDTMLNVRLLCKPPSPGRQEFCRQFELKGKWPKGLKYLTGREIHHWKERTVYHEIQLYCCWRRRLRCHRWCNCTAPVFTFILGLCSSHIWRERDWASFISTEWRISVRTLLLILPFTWAEFFF